VWVEVKTSFDQIIRHGLVSDDRNDRKYRMDWGERLCEEVLQAIEKCRTARLISRREIPFLCFERFVFHMATHFGFCEKGLEAA